MTRIKRVPSYPVMEAFYSIQGEGFYQGYAAYFLRLGGCDVGCVWCDVKERWDAKKHAKWSTEYMLEIIKNDPTQMVVVTGGEPLMHDCTELTHDLKEEGYQLHIETSGAYPISGEWDWICVSPKKFKAPLPEVLKKANELKVIIYHRSDFDWAEQFAKEVNPDCKLFLQPEWSKSKEMMPQIVQYIQTHPQWVLSLQIHKYMGVR
jgi:organic radical activating enzyme